MPGMAKKGTGESTVWLNDCYGSLAQTAGTIISRLVPPNPGLRSMVLAIDYLPAATAHTITILTSQAKTTISTDAASGQADIVLTQMPSLFNGGLTAANDYVVVRHEDYTWGTYVISSISALTVTLTGNLSTDVLKDAPIYVMGVAADHSTNRAFLTTASVLWTFRGGDFRLRHASSMEFNEPLLVNSDNATNAGNMKLMAYGYDGE